MARITRGVAAAAFALALPLLMVTSTVRWLAGDVGYLQQRVRAHGAAERTGLPPAELNRAVQEIVDYFENDARVLRIIVTVDGREEALFDEHETEHMRDVKALMGAVFRIQEVALVVVVSYVALVVLWAGETSVRKLAVLALGGIGAGLAAIGVIAAFAIAGFDRAWTQFHEIAFRNDLWRLDPDTDRLIQMFPEPFWQEATYLAGALIGAQMLLTAALCAVYLIVASRRAAEGTSGAG